VENQIVKLKPRHYEGGRLRANQDLAAAERDQAAIAYRKAALSAFEEVENAMTACRESGIEEQAARDERDADATTLKLARGRFEQGYSSYLEVLDAERASFASELLLAQTAQARFEAQVNLFLAVGGGWTAGP